jgi:hypothetical protein
MDDLTQKIHHGVQPRLSADERAHLQRLDPSERLLERRRHLVMDLVISSRVEAPQEPGICTRPVVEVSACGLGEALLIRAGARVQPVQVVLERGSHLRRSSRATVGLDKVPP